MADEKNNGITVHCVINGTGEKKLDYSNKVEFINVCCECIEKLAVAYKIVEQEGKP